jgi:hypothetical protein
MYRYEISFFVFDIIEIESEFYFSIKFQNKAHGLISELRR